MVDHPLVPIEDLAILFRYKNPDTARHAIIMGRFPIPTFRRGKRIYAYREVVRDFFQKKREEGQRYMEENANMIASQFKQGVKYPRTTARSYERKRRWLSR